ncbi:MAG: PilN domain-containing protein [candidate division WOR-3 bacterium]
MIKVDLLPKERKPKVAAKKPRAPGVKMPSITVKGGIVIIVGVVILVLVCGILFISQKSRISGLNRKIAQYTAKLDSLRPYVERVKALEQKEQEMNRYIEPIKTLNQNRFFVVHLMDELSLRLPDYTWLTSVNITPTTIEIKGATVSNLWVAEFMNRLEDSPYLSGVELVVLQKEKVENQEIMSFTLTATATAAAQK